MKTAQIENIERLRALADANLNVAGNAIHFRLKRLKLLCKNIHTGKLSISACHRANISSRAAYWSVHRWIVEVKDCEQVLKFLRGSLSLASDERYALDRTLDLIREGDKGAEHGS